MGMASGCLFHEYCSLCCDSGVDPFIDVDQVDVLEPTMGSTSVGTSGHTCTLRRLALGCIVAPPIPLLLLHTSCFLLCLCDDIHPYLSPFTGET